MRVSVLASGSRGNATFIELDGRKLLVDAGISARRIKAGLGLLGVEPEELDGVLVTHEHRDHIGGLATLTKRYGVPVFTRPDTFAAMYCRDEIPAACRHAIGDQFAFGGVRVEAFNIPHDAADPVGFCLYGESVKCTFATDLGFVTSSVQAAVDLSDVLILEANHDLAMLKGGAYPQQLKRRILGNRGHLSNDEAAWTLVRMKKKRRTAVLLAHLSEENNRPSVARDTVCAIMRGQGCDPQGAFDLRLTKQNEMVTL